MSIRNFPLIPKIILRKSVDQAKGEQNPLSKLTILICANLEDFDVLSRAASYPLLNRKNNYGIR